MDLTTLTTALSGRYTIDREIGRGGMATVYLARDLRHDRRVALKVLHPELAAAIGPERFLREIRLTAQLQHSHILPLFDSGEAPGHLWYVMPYVAGESLRQRLDREKFLPVDGAIRIAGDVLSALTYAHARGVVHRDIKPENILLEEESAILADFGIAQALSAVGGERLTESGLTFGTPVYMSPEQAGGQPDLDGRSDQYSLACVLYEMLVGQPPFGGASAHAVAARHALDPVPPLRTVRSAVPPQVDAAISKALEKLPPDRFSSAADFAKALTAEPTGARPAATPRRARSTWIALGAIALAALGIISLILSRRSTSQQAAAAPVPVQIPRLAVLPFDNLGDSATAYFADGVADAVRGKLAALAGLEVIGRASSVTYSRTTKSPQAVAGELNVRYLLTGTVRRTKAGDGSSHVEVSPELLEVRGTSAPALKWQQPFDAALTDVFQVQADIAGRVADALDLALGITEHRQLARRPTADLAAYDAFLKGEAAAQALAAEDLVSLRRATPFYQEAVDRDSTFGIAWARLALAHALLYGFGSPEAAEAERASAALRQAERRAPAAQETYRARAVYEDFIRRDFPAALRVSEQGLREYPDDPDLTVMAAVDLFRVGRVDAVIERLSRARALDPRSFTVARNLGYALICRHRWSEARAALDHALSLAPADVNTFLALVRAYVGEGDVAGAQGVLSHLPPGIDRLQRAAYVAYEDLYWILDDSTQRQVLTLPSTVLDERSDWALMRAQVYHSRGATALARTYADSARIELEKRLVAAPSDPWAHVLLGESFAYLGRKADAIREGERGAGLRPISQDALGGPDVVSQLVLIYLQVNEPDKALDQLEVLFKMPYYLSAARLRIDPGYQRLKGLPRFERLVNGGG